MIFDVFGRCVASRDELNRLVDTDILASASADYFGNGGAVLTGSDYRARTVRGVYEIMSLGDCRCRFVASLCTGCDL